MTGAITFSTLQPAGVSGTILQQITLPGRTKDELTDDDVHVINSGQVPTDGDPGDCTGSATAPTAAEGKVCIYINEPSANVTAVEGKPTDFLPDSAFNLSIDVDGTGGQTTVTGSWAYNQPDQGSV